MDYSKLEKDIYHAMCRINKNLKQNGLERYDPNDTRYLFTCNNRICKLILYMVRLASVFFPRFIRRLFQVKKRLYPTALSHLGEAGILARKLNVEITYDAMELAKLAIDEYGVLDNDYLWKYFENRSFYPTYTEKQPSMPMHGLARLGMFVYKTGVEYNDYNLISISALSAIKAIEQHRIYTYDNNAKSIAYFYNSNECTINVNSEYAEWLSYIPKDYVNSRILGLLEGIIELVLQNQEADGSWGYFSKEFEKTNNIVRDNKMIDSHHSMTVIGNLIGISKCDYIKDDLKSRCMIAAERGIGFALANFIDADRGIVYTFAKKKRLGGSAQYGETIIAFSRYIESSPRSSELQKMVKNTLPLIVRQMLRFVKNDGSCPSERIIKYIYYDSIRWGSGIVLQSLLKYLTVSKLITNNE